jgi:hypothetical protein
MREIREIREIGKQFNANGARCEFFRIGCLSSRRMMIGFSRCHIET